MGALNKDRPGLPAASTQERGRLPALPFWLVAASVIALCGCAQASNPEPSRLYDGRYVGTRTSNLMDPCGITATRGRTAAEILGGNLKMQLFTPDTKMTGTVGADGVLRASGLWKSPHGFHNFTILHGRVADGLLTGTASDFRCMTEIALTKVRRR